MKSLILQTTLRVLLPLVLLFSIFLLVRGHNDPGGGFVGGLAASAAFTLYAFTFGVDQTRSLLHIRPFILAAAGLAIAVLSGLIAIPAGLPFLTALWTPATTPVVGTIGTPLLFDAGVYCVVLGVVLTIVFELMEE
jgi:multicomponent Na+:H+ antiporter subunit B